MVRAIKGMATQEKASHELTGLGKRARLLRGGWRRLAGGRRGVVQLHLFAAAPDRAFRKFHTSSRRLGDGKWH